jgi:hypothetical protein
MADSAPDISGMVNDPDFAGLPPAQKREALYKLTSDTSFNSLSDDQTTQFVSRLTRPGMPKPPQPNMQETDYFGNPLDKGLIGLAAQGREGYISDPGVSGAMSVAGAATGAALTGAAYGPAAAKAIADMAEAHPFAAQLVKKALQGAAFAGGAGTVAKHTKWLMNLLP